MFLTPFGLRCTFAGPDNERALRGAVQPAVAVDQVGHVLRHGHGGGVH